MQTEEKQTAPQVLIANPPPWEIFGDAIRGYGVRDAKHRVIIEQFTLPKITAEFIAAAPELFAVTIAAAESSPPSLEAEMAKACKYAVTSLFDLGADEKGETVIKLRAVLARYDAQKGTK